MATRTWTILADNVPTIKKLLERLNRKASRHGMTGLSMHVGNLSTIKDGPDVYVMRDVSITGETPRMNGWQFVATIQHAGEAGNILRTIPTWTGDLPEEFRTTDPGRCDHCNAYRRRNDTFVVTDGAVFRQVGRQCLADFVGSDRIDSTLSLAECWALISDGCNGASDYGSIGNGDRYYALDELVQFAAQIVITEGWVPRSKAEDWGKAATADLTITGIEKSRKDGGSKYLPSEDAITLATKALEWAPSWLEREKNRNEVSDYVWNMSVVLATPYVKARSVGLAVSILGAFQRDQEMQLKRQRERENTTSVHVGTVGKRQEFRNLTVKAFRTIESMYGVTTIITYTDPDGNIIKWFASGYHEVTPGDTVSLVASVKSHGEWNGVPETTITRAKVK